MNSFTALGLPASAGITDADVRAAWRHTAAATHPDRADGGDPAAYAAAANAYTQLRTHWGRTEALADLTPAPPAGIPAPHQCARPGPAASVWHTVAMLPARARRGRPARLAIRTVTAIAVAVLTVLVIPGTPSAPAVVAGCGLWWALTARGDLAPPPGR